MSPMRRYTVVTMSEAAIFSGTTLLQLPSDIPLDKAFLQIFAMTAEQLPNGFMLMTGSQGIEAQVSPTPNTRPAGLRVIK